MKSGVGAACIRRRKEIGSSPGLVPGAVGTQAHLDPAYTASIYRPIAGALYKNQLGALSDDACSSRDFKAALLSWVGHGACSPFYL